MKYLIPVIAVVALGLGVLNAIPTKILGGQYSTNHAYFSGITNQGTLTQTGAVTTVGLNTITGDQTVSDDLAVAGSMCFAQGGVYYTLVASTTAMTPTLTSSTASCL
jgi:hypothetical protein